ncbi:unnamed protein product [Allacma fusca]|uniref:Peptidase A2 domain-containing protein n=1 Tax=Allacma fusca TaxID=39272 RepID=A0A8J2KZY4_9HEXA|nr:unnamed protein product [Allacma fusca]
MLSLKNSRSGYKAVATKLKQSLDTQDPNVLTRSTYNMFIVKLQDITTKLEDNHSQILDACADEAEVNLHIADYESSLDTLMEMSLKLSSWDDTLTRKEAADYHHQQSQPTQVYGPVKVNLPKLELPKFTGRLEDWITFSDLFTHVVHANNELSGAQKLQYLKSALQGDEARLLDAITIADGNYETAWKIVTDRYQHTREILHTLINKFLHQPEVQQESATSLLNMIDVTNQSLNALRVLNCKPEEWNVILVTVIMNKLDLETRRVYERSLYHNEMPTFEELMRFLQKQSRALNAGGLSSAINKKHHTLLHREDAKVEAKREAVPGLTIKSSNSESVLLFTAVIRVMDHVGHQHDCRALLDTGSQASFISTACANKLNLPQMESSTEVTGLAGVGVAHAGYTIKFQMESRVYPSCHATTEALVVPKVTCELPITHVDSNGWSHIQGLKLADPEYHRSRSVDILLGANILNKIMKPAKIDWEDGTPSAQDTIFG